MNKTVSAFSRLTDPIEIAAELSDQIRTELMSPPSALIVFASPKQNLPELLTALETTLEPSVLVGCSSAGEFADLEAAEGAVSAMAIYSDEIEFKLCVGNNMKSDPEGAAVEMTSCLGPNVYRFKHRYILILTDALAGHTEEFLSKVNEHTAGAFQLFGGGAGDDAAFHRTFVFYNKEVLQDAAVGLAMLSNRPFGIGVRHGWKPLGTGQRATEVNGFELVSLNAEAAVDVLARHAAETGQRLDKENPMPFFLHNVLGVATPAGYKIRVPLAFTERGGVICATEIPLGSTVHIMSTDGGSAAEAAELAAETALDQIGGHNPAGVIFFDCVATRLRLGTKFGEELSAVREKMSNTAFVGCNSYGQVSRVDGQFSGFHNCTAVVCVIPA